MTKQIQKKSIKKHKKNKQKGEGGKKRKKRKKENTHTASEIIICKAGARGQDKKRTTTNKKIKKEKNIKIQKHTFI